MKHIRSILSFFILLTASGSFHLGAQTNTPTPLIQMPDGIVLLHASNAVVHGMQLRYEPQTNKNCLGFWTKPEDWASWSFEIKQPGEFTIEITQGCGKGQGGSDVNIEVGGKTLSFVVKDTGGFQNWEAIPAGTVKLSSGVQTLAVKPQNKKKAAVMDIRQIRLLPAAKTEEKK